MSQFAVLVNARGNGVGELQADERWSLVHQWCEDRGIYVGRGRGGAVFYAPQPEGLMPFWVELRRILLTQFAFDPVDFRVKTVAEVAAAAAATPPGSATRVHSRVTKPSFGRINLNCASMRFNLGW